MNQNHTIETNYTKLAIPRQIVLPLDYGNFYKINSACTVTRCCIEEIRLIMRYSVCILLKEENLKFHRIFYSKFLSMLCLTACILRI